MHWGRARRSDLEAEVHDVAFLHDVILAFESPPARFLRALLAIAGDVVVVGDDLGTDETRREIRVNLARSLRRRRARAYRPGADLLLAGGEKVLSPSRA